MLSLDLWNNSTVLDELEVSIFGFDVRKYRFTGDLFVCFQTSVYTLGEFHQNRNNSTVFEELSVSIVDLTVANICFTSFDLRRQ
jgi:hypothetical protein